MPFISDIVKDETNQALCNIVKDESNDCAILWALGIVIIA